VVLEFSLTDGMVRPWDKVDGDDWFTCFVESTTLEVDSVLADDVFTLVEGGSLGIFPALFRVFLDACSILPCVADIEVVVPGLDGPFVPLSISDCFLSDWPRVTLDLWKEFELSKSL